MPTIITQLNIVELQKMITDAVELGLSSQRPPSDLPKPSEDGMYRQADLCRLFQVSKPTIIDWQKNGRLPFVRIGRSVYFPKSEVDALLRKGINKRESYAKGGLR